MAIAKAQGLKLDLVQVDHIGESRKKLLEINPLGQIPVFVGPDGFVLTECIPITLYRRGIRISVYSWPRLIFVWGNISCIPE